jgi:hypothetical protein
MQAGVSAFAARRWAKQAEQLRFLMDDQERQRLN